MTFRNHAREWAGDIGACVGFFTRLPVPFLLPSARPFAASLRAAPMAGLVVGVCGGATFWLAARIGLPASVSAALCLAATMLITGCLHEDGLADVADGFGGGGTRDRKLEIMRDSRIGAYGVAALALSILLRWSALAALLSPVDALVALVAAQVAARALLPAFMVAVAPARSDGLSAGIGDVESTPALTAVLLGGLALLPLGLGVAALTAIALGICFVLVKRLCEGQIGGQTGDVLGLLEQSAEVIVLLAACIAFR